MLLLINDKKLMMNYTNGPIFNVIAWVTSIVMIGSHASSDRSNVLNAAEEDAES